jgi:hypothetical protein
MVSRQPKGSVRSPRVVEFRFLILPSGISTLEDSLRVDANILACDGSVSKHHVDDGCYRPLTSGIFVDLACTTVVGLGVGARNH